jgi:DNA-binding transcriptional MerR regulator
MRIGSLSAATGASPRSLRYYEQLGLISSERSANGYRDYGEDALTAVQMIKKLLALGFPTELISQILPCTESKAVPVEACPSVVSRMTEIRDAMDSKVADMTATRDTLTRFLAIAEQSATATS